MDTQDAVSAHVSVDGVLLEGATVLRVWRADRDFSLLVRGHDARRRVTATTGVRVVVVVTIRQAGFAVVGVLVSCAAGQVTVRLLEADSLKLARALWPQA